MEKKSARLFFVCLNIESNVKKDEEGAQAGKTEQATPKPGDFVVKSKEPV